EAIRRHEPPRPDKEDDRARHIEPVGENAEPVFLTYRARAQIDAAITELTAGAPEYDFTAEDGVGHTFWLAPSAWGAKIESAFREVPSLYVADGHHRTAAASRVRHRYRELGKPIVDEERF